MTDEQKKDFNEYYSMVFGVVSKLKEQYPDTDEETLIKELVSLEKARLDSETKKDVATIEGGSQIKCSSIEADATVAKAKIDRSATIAGESIRGVSGIAGDVAKGLGGIVFGGLSLSHDTMKLNKIIDSVVTPERTEGIIVTSSTGRGLLSNALRDTSKMFLTGPKI